MPRFAPFAGIRYATDELGLVTAPPYDVIDDAERAALAAQHPANVVRIDLPVGGADPYGEAARTFDGWQQDGTLRADPPSLYVYSMAFTDEAGRQHRTTGVIGALGLEAPGEGDVLPHERTTPKAKSDRLQLMRATESQLSPVWGLSLSGGELSKLLADAAVEPIGSWADADGVEHHLARVDGASPSARALCDAIAGSPVVIADGHHRYETALALQAERPDLPGADATLCYVVDLVEDELTVQPIHRLLRGLPEGTDVAAALASTFVVSERQPLPDAGVVDRLVAHGVLALVTADGMRELKPRREVLEGVPDLDTARLDAGLESLPAHELSFQHGVANIVRAVTTGDAQAGVLLRPVPVATISAMAHAREKMPPKSTFFWPKPRTGIVFRSLR